MNICVIISEYNPFHNGHKYMIDKVREQLGKDTAIIAIMSGNFVQRGDVAITNKFLRTKSALQNGVNLVIELPVNFAVNTANKFAYMGVKIADICRAATHIAFGSECGDIDLIKSAVLAMNDQKTDKIIKDLLKTGITYAKARQTAIENLYGKNIARLLSSPNDILAINYVDALIKLGSNITPIAIKRTGANHDSQFTNDDFASASFIRDEFFNNNNIEKYLPKSSYDILINAKADGKIAQINEKTERVIMDRLRTLSKQDFAKLCDISEGLEGRIYEGVISSCTLNEVYDKIKTKRYTLSRIRRLILNAALHIFNEEEPAFLRVLGFDDIGKSILSLITANSELPIVTSYKDAKKISEISQSQFEACAEQTDFYNLLTEKVFAKNDELSSAVVKI